MGFVYNKVDSVDYSDLGVTLSDPATQLRSGVKALNSNGVLVTGAMPEHGDGSNLIIHPNTSDYSQDVVAFIPEGYYDGNAKATAEYNTVYTQGHTQGVTDGHTEYNTGVTLANTSSLASGVKARKTDGTLITGTLPDYLSGVTYSDARQLASGVKARTANGTLVSGTRPTDWVIAQSYPSIISQAAGSYTLNVPTALIDGYNVWLVIGVGFFTTNREPEYYMNYMAFSLPTTRHPIDMYITDMIETGSGNSLRHIEWEDDGVTFANARQYTLTWDAAVSNNSRSIIRKIGYTYF